MTQSFESPVAPADNLKELPKLGALEIFGRVLRASQERNDMLSGLQRSHEKYGEAVAFNLPAMKMVNLFGPDANRFVLLDQDTELHGRDSPQRMAPYGTDGRGAGPVLLESVPTNRSLDAAKEPF